MMRKPHWEHIVFGDDQPLLRKYRDVADNAKSLAEALVHTRSQWSKYFNSEKFVADFGHGPFQSWAFINTASLYSIFCRDGEKIFKMAREFGAELAKVDLKLTPRLVPKNETVICIEFPEHILFQSGDDFFHCVYIGVASLSGVDVGRLGAQTFVEMVWPCYTGQGELKDEELNTTLVLSSSDKTIADAISRADSKASVRIPKEPVEYAIKCLLYIYSGDPDLRSYRAPKMPSKVKKARRFLRLHENASLVNMTWVGFDFKKPPEYRVGETMVSGHPRLQPYGPQRSNVKLIWINAHKRVFKGKGSEHSGTN